MAKWLPMQAFVRPPALPRGTAALAAASLAVFLLTSLATGCDSWNERGSLPLAGTQPVTGSPGVVTEPTDAGTPPPPPASYETMCSNYCMALFDTNVYGCLAAGQGDATTCASRSERTRALCEEMRCAPMLVNQANCFQQCDALAPRYEAYCALATASAQLCPTPAQAHDDACRAGCALEI